MRGSAVAARSSTAARDAAGRQFFELIEIVAAVDDACVDERRRFTRCGAHSEIVREVSTSLNMTKGNGWRACRSPRKAWSPFCRSLYNEPEMVNNPSVFALTDEYVSNDRFSACSILQSKAAPFVSIPCPTTVTCSASAESAVDCALSTLTSAASTIAAMQIAR